jgi:hypothetical protein
MIDASSPLDMKIEMPSFTLSAVEGYHRVLEIAAVTRP